MLLFIGYRFVFFVCFRTDGDAWQGLKAPTVHHDQRSKFRQQTAPYIRPNQYTNTISLSKDFTQSKDNIIKKHLPKKYPQPHCDACCWFAPGSSGSTVFHQKKSTIKMMYYYLMPLKKNPKKKLPKQGISQSQSHV